MKIAAYSIASGSRMRTFDRIGQATWYAVAWTASLITLTLFAAPYFTPAARLLERLLVP